MRYWWVNQNQTFEQEVLGGYLWSPKRKNNGHRNPFYDFMRDVASGDVIFSYCNTRLAAISVALGPCFEAPKPKEFGSTGQNWSQIGWKIRVRYLKLEDAIRPADHMALLAPVLPKKYSPLQPSGSGLQSVYLAPVPPAMASVLRGLIGFQARTIIDQLLVEDRALYDPGQIPEEVVEWETHLVRQIEEAAAISDTERAAIIKARRGQGLFRKNVMAVESRCRVTKVDRAEHLVASHSKPWRDCESNGERLDGNNGLLLTPTIDHLFDRGFISFDSGGRLLVSRVVHRDSLRRMGIDASRSVNVGTFSTDQDGYLEYHREKVFLDSGLRG